MRARRPEIDVCRCGGPPLVGPLHEVEDLLLGLDGVSGEPGHVDVFLAGALHLQFFVVFSRHAEQIPQFLAVNLQVRGFKSVSPA